MNAGGSPLEVVQACLAAHRALDWTRLRALFHPEARIGVFAGGGTPDDPERAIAAMQRAHAQDAAYQASVSNMRQLDGRAVLLHGRVRHSTRDGGFADVERYWLYVVRDGRLYRSAVYGSAEEALAAYEEQGEMLGA
ncbi:MAG TPA: hypothetical protein VNJ53_00205 [Gaiellaceae bacterium]|nr:hypothetical protein [Gaiellaceae bacterium]